MSEEAGRSVGEQRLIEQEQTREKLYRAIGRFVYEFSRLEGEVKNCGQKLLGLSEDQFWGIMPAVDFAAACNLCRAALDRRATIESNTSAVDVKKSRDLFSEALRVNEDRIRVVHGIWLSTHDVTGSFHSSRNKFELLQYFATPDELERKADQIHKLTSQLFFLHVILIKEQS